MRISVTDLDSFRYYRESEEMTLETFLARLNRLEPPTPQMLAGRALHKLLENAGPHDEFLGAESDGFKFYFACEIDLALPQVRELKGEVTLQTKFGPVTLVGIVDGMDTAVYDYKLTARFDAERYSHSYQWRCYLTMFGGSRFDYRVFVGQEDDGECVIREYQELSLYRYPGIERDVADEVERFVEFLREYAPEARAA